MASRLMCDRLELATRPQELAMIKSKLSENRLEMPLFDIRKFTRNIEAAYSAIYDRHRSGLEPDHISIP